ncbi:uncharacterized protein I206_102467 [Kwoniella pini CBS 10737]|uniref:Uncharacterized protein n=1 Tax=Kwoniella pini CBS 10737 TaxID=1296096 RepID=A0A1B9I5F6_9TREE|nr:uncharacterized protein I206_02818 [Kwoniella pini CBS 10737]OCF50762.1 hypothetical protein I206_02818 [Kwoniella pini CBS 10737]
MPSLRHAFAWTAYKFASTVLDDIWPLVLFFAGVATMVCCVSRFSSTDLGINSVMLTVLGTIVSLIVSFKTNSSYGRWWDGRNVWANLTSNSRQLAMIIWMQIPNAPPPPKDEDKKEGKDAKAKKPKKDPVSKETLQSYSTAQSSAHPSFSDSDEGDGTDDEEEKAKEEEEKARLNMQGLVEKKTYIGLVQAFAVSVKHALRGEVGPFYSDLYHLIAFLPKYNPSAYPPINRSHILALWQNGLPRDKAGAYTDKIAVPLTTSVAFRTDALNQRDLPDPFVDTEKGPSPSSNGSISSSSGIGSGLNTDPKVFKKQAIQSAKSFVQVDNPDIFALNRQRSSLQTVRSGKYGRSNNAAGEEGITLATVELMPPRHPPTPRFWDFFPPLRIFKIIYDWFRWHKLGDNNERAKGGKRKRKAGNSMEIPQELLMYLQAYVTDLISRGMMNSSLISPTLTAIMELQKSISDLEKIATTPIPSAYTFHLRLTVYIYLFCLPFQIYDYIGWVSIPATALAATIYLGFLEIGMQIEMPFAYDQSDLDLDKFVLRIAHQIAQITAFPTHIPASHVVLSHLNQPFLPSLDISAPDLLGIPERQPKPTEKGFAHSWCSYDGKHASGHDHKNKKGLRNRKYKSPEEAHQEGMDHHEDLHSSPVGQSHREEEEEEEVVFKPKPLAKNMRDIEMALNANWREITAETEDFIGKPRDQLENRTGLEVAVLTL